MSSDETRSRSCCISHQFFKAASHNPNNVALIHARFPNHGHRCFIYSHLLASVNSLASRLRSSIASSSGPRIVGIYAPPSAEYVASVLAVLRCGEAFLPLDPSWPKARVLSAMASSNVDLVIASKSPFGFESGSNWLAESATCPVLWFSLEEDGGGGDPQGLAWPCENGRLRQFCYVMYTSGSTGKPKGVCGTEQGLLNRFLWMQELYPLNGDETLLFKTSISFVDHLQEFFSALLTACTLVIPPFNQLKANLFSIIDFIQAYSINRLNAVPSLIRTILPALESQHNIHALSSLKLLVLSGEVLPISLWEMLSKILPGTAVLNFYGSTEAFCDVLMVAEVSDDDDFFMMGGNSIAAAHLSNNLGVDMRLLYYFPSPSKLCTTLLERKRSELYLGKDVNWEMNLKQEKRKLFHAVHSKTPNPANNNSGLKLLGTHHGKDEIHAATSKRLKLDSNVNVTSEGLTPLNFYPWNTASTCFSCSFSRCNNVLYECYNKMNEYDNKMDEIHQATCLKVSRNKNFLMQELWKVYLGSCVDASPLIVFRSPGIYLFIGSHSHEFLCVNVRSGYVQWRIQLEGRIECSATILGHFSQVVVGCYKGKLYFLDFSNGSICWTFQTTGEVKSQPVVDIQRQLVWCGSHDHNLYALDYINYCCLYKVSCGGSIFGSPVIDKVNDTLYIASTSGRITAISIKAMPFNILWLHELEVPVFGSLAMSSLTGNIICCLVDGHVIALDSSGSKIWKYKICGPIFAGATICSTLPSQVLICSRDGSIYSFEQEKGTILWEYNVGNPITASAYVDEHLCLTSDSSLLSDRLVCVCSSSGSVILLRVKMEARGEADDVEEVARHDLEGDVFSSPVMVGGRIFVGCRDDYVHCLDVIM
ncbi:putative acyl-activating enzyme 19 isoform X4 [Humulus lupulus]|uniref:putative acyl-activating enzyme 19 isoform X4 n=1 Tax=Humulus lupulus TaxID=3486 RepID=UPI002B41175D|nr:putative acyl-activating enzyme 19 isoform X4 [Humulus lupulus]